MEIARVVWELGHASARQVHESLPKARKIDFTTVQTYLSRLEEKGYIKSRREGRAKIFLAKANPTSVIRETVNDLVERLFGGDKLPLVRHLIEDADMSAEGVKELREMLDEIEQDRD